MGTEGLEQRQRGDEEEEDDEELFDSDSLLSNSDDGDDRVHAVETNQNGPLFELSTLVEQLPIKIRGLSKYYQGKSQSFTSLSVVRTLEDLPKKKQSPCKRKTMMKTCDSSYGGGGRVMSRKAPRAASCAALAAQGGSGGRKPPLVPDLQKNSWNSH